jgi:hypothetical protein
MVVTVAACSTSHGSSATPPTSTSPRHPVAVTVTGNSCTVSTRFGVGGAANEIHGVSTDAQLWGLALGPGHAPPRPGDELKIVWRMTGSGPLHISFTAPDGLRQPLVFGPEPHSASSYHRPGDEWGTGLRFTTHGCWHIHFTRTNASADVWLNV